MSNMALAIAALALSANAMLIVPDVSPADAVQSLPFETQADSQLRHFELPCPSCPFKVLRPDGEVATATDVPNHLKFDLEVSPDADDAAYDRLTLNGNEIFTSNERGMRSFDVPHLSAWQESDSESVRAASSDKVQIGYGLQNQAVAVDDDHTSALYEITLRVAEVDYSFVDGVPEAMFRVIKTADNRLMIAQVEVADAESRPDEECTTFLCRWMDAVTQAVHKAKAGLKPGCHGKEGKPTMEVGQGHGMHGGHMDGSHPHHHHGHHHDHAGFKHHHSWRQLFWNVIAHIVIPVLVGIIAGVMASAVGMFIGTLVVFVWRVFVRREPAFGRRHCRRGRCHKAGRDETSEFEEKSGLMANQELPPSYEDGDVQADKSDKV